MLLSETPGLETLRDKRIDYDSRLWDDVRGAGGYHTVTGVEDVERTIFDRYNTVLHELTHQVHAVLTADQSRRIQELYVRAKSRDDATKNGYLSRYAGGSVFEYFAEGANALVSPKRDAYDPREEVRERLDAIDPDLRELVKRYLALTDVSAELSGGVHERRRRPASSGRGRRGDSLVREGAGTRFRSEETALRSLATRAHARRPARRRGGGGRARGAGAPDERRRGLDLGGRACGTAVAGLDAAIRSPQKSRATVRPEDR